MHILKIRNLSKSYNTFTALQDISIDIPKQSIFGLLGPNGAGKTTLIRIINQIIAADKGDIFFENKTLIPKHAEKIGYLPEERGLYKKMTVGEQTLYLAQLKGLSKKVAKERAYYWFKKFDILNWWNKKIEELSKGMAQKVQFIVTVLHNPLLLILDEPFSGFDPINVELIKKEILLLRENGTSIIFSTHNMNSVEEICDHIALINNAHKVLDGKVSEIRKIFSKNTFELKIIVKNDFSSFIEKYKIIKIKSCEENNHFVDYKNFAITTDKEYLFLIKIPEKYNSNQLLEDALKVGEVKLFKEYFPSMQEIFINAVKQKQLN